MQQERAVTLVDGPPGPAGASTVTSPATATRLVGIDEAGRGPVIGPMVLAGVHVDDAGLEALDALGLADSKAYGSSDDARETRQRLAATIRTVAQVETVSCEPPEIDAWVSRGGLNELERDAARRIIRALDCAPTRIVADGERLFSPLRDELPMLEAYDKAESREVVVAAASIVAKHERDRALSEIYARYDEFGPIRGGGYPNVATAKFLRAFVERHQRLPSEVRLSWGWKVLRELREAHGLVDDGGDSGGDKGGDGDARA